LFVFFLRSLLY